MAPDFSSLAVIEAINKADLQILRSVLKSMCKASPICEHEAAQRLLVPAAKRKVEDGCDAADVAKRQRTEDSTSRYEKCITRRKVFDTTENLDDSCRTHDELVTIDEDYFPDDDDIKYGDHPSNWEKDWRFKAFPKGFFYECCDARADEVACVVQKHISAGVGNATADTSSEGEEEDDEDGNEDEDEDEDE